MGAISALILVITSAGLASASSVATAVVDTTAPTGEVSLAAGGPNAAIQINMTVKGSQDGTATFQIYRDWSLVGGTFTGSNPETFTVLPREGGDPSLTLSTSGTISAASGQALGNFTLAIGAFGITNSNTTGGKLALGTSSNYLVHIVAPSDSTPPVITSNVTGTVNNGWYTSDVSVSWIVTDAQSAVTTSTGCGSTTISTDTTGTTLTCSATSGGGTASRSISIKRDATAPTLVATPSAAPNGAGYNNSPVDVSYTCSDDTSGLVAGSCPITDNATADGTNIYSHTVYDNAGNSASVSTTVTLDATKPSISGSRSPAANGAGWNNSDVTVTFTCGDTGADASGVKSCVADGTSPASKQKTLSNEVANQSVSGTATDNADNTNTATVSGISIDKTPPLIEFASRTAANANGWNNGNVVVTWGCTDGGSGVVNSTVTKILAADGASQSSTGTCVDRAGNTASNTVTGINIDTTPPAITFDNQAPGTNEAGWNKTDVTVTWQCSDGVSSVLHAAVSKAVSTEGAGQEATGTCEDLAGNTASNKVTGINIDKTAPGVVYTSASPAANLAGWNKTDVIATFTATDSLSGFAGPSNTTTGTTTTIGQGEGLTVSSPSFTDLAGNTTAAGAATSDPFKVDKTAPIITFDNQTPGTNEAGWNKTDVTVTWQCSDGVSSVLHAAVSKAVSTEGAGQEATGTCEDLAGNTASNKVTGINIDMTAPGVVYTSASPAANLAGWNKTDVIATFTATDSLSGFAGPSNTTTGTTTTIGQGEGLTVSSPSFTDLAGNTTAAGAATSVPFNVDKTAPTVSLVGGPSDGASYYFGSVPAAPTCVASDALSDLAGNCVVSGGGTTVGPHSYTATATDKAGNQATATHNYNVLAWTLNGFYQPVDMNGVLNTVKGGSTVPLKFEVFAGSTELTSTSVVLSFDTQKINCTSGSGIEDAIEVLSTGGTSLRYDSTGGQFIQNWKTPTGAGSCYSATMTTLDGSIIKALFKLK